MSDPLATRPASGSARPPAATLPGRSRTIVVEPAEPPAEVPLPAPAPEPPEPPAPEPERTEDPIPA